MRLIIEILIALSRMFKEFRLASFSFCECAFIKSEFQRILSTTIIRSLS